MSARTFLDRLFAGCDGGLVELCAVPSRQRCWTTPGHWSAFGPFVTAAVNARQDVYASLATRRDPTSGTESNLQELPALWTDIDAPPATVRTRLDGFPLPWSLLVGSGLGTHVYWRLREPLDVSTVAGIAQAASLLRRLSAYVDGDDRATSPAAKPRLPGTKNFKYPHPQPVALLEAPDGAVNLCELDDLLPAEVVRQNQMTITSSIPVGHRHNVLFSLSRSLLLAGLPFSAVSTAVRSVNATVCETPLPDHELLALLSDALKRPHRANFHVPPPPRVVLHDLPTKTVPVQERPPHAPGLEALLAALVAVGRNGGLPSREARDRAGQAGVPERTLRSALRRAGLEPSYTGRGVTRQVLWTRIDTRHEENR